MDSLPQSVTLEGLHATVHDLRHEYDSALIGTLVIAGIDVRNVHVDNLSSMLENFSTMQDGEDKLLGWLEDTDLTMRCISQVGSEIRRIALLSGDEEIATVDVTSSELIHDNASLKAVLRVPSLRAKRRYDD